MKNQRSPARIRETSELLDKQGICVFYENCDFLTVKLSRSCPAVWTLCGVVPNSDDLPMDFGNFRIRWFGLVSGSKLKVLHVLDSFGNMVAAVHLKTELETTAKSFHDDIEFVGLFWTAYSEYFPEFCSYFGIDPAKSGIVSRFDYCVDLAGISAHDLLSRVVDKSARAQIVRVGGEETYRKIESPTRHSLVVYNKRLDVLDKNKHKIKVDVPGPDGEPLRPYAKYKDATFPIARIEFRKKARALREMNDSSIVALWMSAKQMTADHFGSCFDFDLQTVFESSSTFDRVRIPKKQDVLVNSFVEKKAKTYLDLFFAYAENYALLKGQKQLFRHFFRKYGTHLTDWVVRESPHEPVHLQSALGVFQNK